MVGCIQFSWSNLPVELHYCNNRWHMLYWKSRMVWQKGQEKNPSMLCSFCQHSVFTPGFCSAGPETLGVREAWAPLFLGVLVSVTALVLYSPRRNSENAAVTKLCVEGEGCACHILILQTLCIGRYNKRPNLPNLSKKNVAEDGQTECLRNIIFFEKEH